MLLYYANVNISHGEFGTAFAVVACSGDLAITKVLLDAGADVKIQGGWYYSSALAASTNNEIDQPCTNSTIRSICKVGFNASARRKGENVTDVLLDAGADVFIQEHKALSTTSRKGHIKVIELLLRRGCRPNPSPKRSEDPILHRTVRSGNVEIVKALIENAVNPNEKDYRGETALCKALYSPSAVTLSHTAVLI